MNVENVKKAVDIMKRAKYVEMSSWQEGYSGRVATTEEELHACGNSACFAGHIAVSPEFQADGGCVDEAGGVPVLNAYPEGPVLRGSLAIANWLGISDTLANLFVFGCANGPPYDEGFNTFYGKDWTAIDAQDVIDKLCLLLVKGEDYLLANHNG